MEQAVVKVLKEGWLEKQGGNVHSWKRRWFVLHAKSLDYYKDKTMKEQLGTIPIIDCHVTVEPETDGHGYYFACVLPPTSSAKRTKFLMRSPVDTERDDWIQAINRANTVTLYKCPLQNAFKVNPAKPGIYIPIPYFIVKGIKYVEEYLLTEGIYRLNGNRKRIEETLEQTINANLPVEFQHVHDATGIMKGYMTDLPEPLFLEKNYFTIKKLQYESLQKQIEVVSQILRSLPIVNYVLIVTLFEHLLKVMAKKAENLMGDEAIGVCIGPSLVWATEGKEADKKEEANVQKFLAMMILNNYDTIFTSNPLRVYGSTGESSVGFYKLNCEQDALCPYTLSAMVGTVVQVVAEDDYGWTVCVWNETWGVVHKNFLDRIETWEAMGAIAKQTNKWIVSSEELVSIGEKCPQASRLYNMLLERSKELRTRVARRMNTK